MLLCGMVVQVNQPGTNTYTREERGGVVSEKAKFTITEKLKLQVCMRAREGKGERGPRGVWKV
jgi:hypothetical protein